MLIQHLESEHTVDLCFSKIKLNTAAQKGRFYLSISSWLERERASDSTKIIWNTTLRNHCRKLFFIWQFFLIKVKQVGFVVDVNFLKLQLALQQHRPELRRSNYIWFFPTVNTTVLHGLHLKSSDTEHCGQGGLTVSCTWTFNCLGGSVPFIPTLFKGQSTV